MQTLIRFMLGDPSADGHGMSETYYYTFNASYQTLQQIYSKAVEVTGVDFKRDVARNYEDNYLYANVAKMFLDHGVKVDEMVDDWQYPTEELIEDGETSGYLYDDIYMDLFLEFLKIGAEAMEYRLSYASATPDSTSWDIGGYGLFSH